MRGIWKDAYEMTPLHVLATSATLRLDLLQVRLDNDCPLEVLSQRDDHGSTMLHYLLKNGSLGSVALIRLVLQKAILEKNLDLEWKNGGWNLVTNRVIGSE
ncbi:unnamed protein product [Cylindrotheca closterium]|uniref:Uncharacterized protein n=1 Tax=Cylindrotheca closterium TaxID=2856 RepID=A0AAD2G2Q2_9STRA|nr:unnamed protein product [Cylindrotheca closterium]